LGARGFGSSLFLQGQHDWESAKALSELEVPLARSFVEAHLHRTPLDDEIEVDVTIGVSAARRTGRLLPPQRAIGCSLARRGRARLLLPASLQTL
jgi:hypothetical protein